MYFLADGIWADIFIELQVSVWNVLAQIKKDIMKNSLKDKELYLSSMYFDKIQRNISSLGWESI